MSSQFTQRIRANLNRSSHSLVKVVDPHPHVQIESVGGEVLNLKESQALTLFRQSATFRAQATGNFANILTSGGSIDIPVRENSGYSHINDVYLRIDISNATGGNVELLPVPQFIDRIDWQTPDGTRIQIQYSDNLWLDTCHMRQSQWELNAPLINADKDWRPSLDIIPNGGTRSYYMKLSANWMKQTGIFLPAVEGEIIARVFFNPAADFVLSGTGPTVTRLELEFEGGFMLDSEYAQAVNRHRLSCHDHRYFYNIRQSFTSNLSPSQQVEVLLSGFNGLFAEFEFYIRAANAAGVAKFDYLPIDRYTLLDSNGTDITGNNEIFRDEDILYYADQHDSKQREEHDIYRYYFNQSHVSDMEQGTLTGFTSFNGRETLRINLPAAEVPKVITLTETIAVTLGYYKLKYLGEETVSMAFNTAAATVEQALENLNIAKKYNTTFTVSDILSNGPITISFGGKLAELYPEEKIEVVHLTLDGVVDSAITQRYVAGFPAGSAQYEIVCMGKQLHRVESTPDGRLVVHST